ncbi:EAL domain-containing protein [Ralstonia sp. RL]|uniref:sensor domain-containing protein n=1 Tax=Ralstonia sp. RL TaxID=1839756 RepID=UPI00257A281E|nr:EAL domain-containing protein [Ralstonia sp. RL]
MHQDIETYKIIAEHAVDPIFFADNQGRVLYANPAAERVFGYSAPEFQGQYLHDMVHHHYPDGSPYPRAQCPAHQGYVAGVALEDMRATYFRKDGSAVDVSVSHTPVRFDEQCIGQLTFVRDVSRRAEADKVLAESELRLRTIIDSIPQPVWVLTPEGRISYVNARFRQVTGLHLQSGDDYIAPVHPDDMERTRAACEESLRSGTEYRIEHRARCADGSYRWFLTHGMPCRDGDGRILAWYGASTDIDDLRRTTDALRRSQETLRLATQAARLGLWEFRVDSGALVWDEANRRMYGLPLDGEITYEMYIDTVHPDERPTIDRVARRMMQPGGPDHFDTVYRIYRHCDGALRWLRVNGQILPGPDGTSAGYVGTTLDITDSKLAEQRIREASQRDALTGLPNRALLFEYVDHLLAVAQRTRRNGALLFIDLDRFKPINDTHGHDVGDQVLKQVARRLLECTRHEDIVGRLGGDEFVVVLPHPDAAHDVATVAHHIVERVSEPYYVGELQLHLSPSIGISLYPRHGDDVDALIKCADSAMYIAKKSGRKCYKFYAPSPEHGADRQLSIELQLRRALEHGDLALHYQPVLDLRSGQVAAVEALLRLPTAHGEPLAPSQFLPVAESAGLVNLLGEWVAREVCRQHQRWRARGLPAMNMAINVAPQQLRQRSFVASLGDNMRLRGMEPSCLQIELKESTVLEDLPDTIGALQEIRALGMRIALDDFGVGYSSIGLLSSLPLDMLKIDRSFIDGIGRDTRSRTIIDSVLALGHSLRLQVAGEGIESETVADYLRSRGCDQAQGFYFSKPLSADEYEHWYRESRIHPAGVH